MQTILGQLESLHGTVDEATAEQVASLPRLLLAYPRRKAVAVLQVKKMTMTTLQNLARVEAQSDALEDSGRRSGKAKKAGEGRSVLFIPSQLLKIFQTWEILFVRSNSTKRRTN